MEDEIGRMTQAFEGAWDILVACGSIYAQPFKATDTRERLARKIIELVRQLGPDIALLQSEALAQLKFTPGPAAPLATTTAPSERP